MHKTEVMNNTPEQVEGYLRAALELTEKVEPPTDLREAFFTQAVALISGKQMILQETPSVGFFDRPIVAGRH